MTARPPNAVPPSPPPTPETLLDRLARLHPASSRQTLRRMIQAGRVTVNGRRSTRANQPVLPEDKVVVADHAAPDRTAGGSGRAARATPPDPRLRVVYEDEDMLVVNKPPGLLTSTGPRERRPTLLALVQAYVGQKAPQRGSRAGLIHRLDRDASGLLVFSKNHAAFRALKQQFFDHSVERLYTAVVEGVPEPKAKMIDSYLVERADGTVYSTKQHGEGERAVTEYEVAETMRRRSVLRVKLYTGRKHQIRVHLSERGTPIVGDAVYGSADDADGGEGLRLAATKLSLTHPRSGERLTFELPRPGWSVLAASADGVKKK